MERGDIDEMSFAFQVIRQQWSPDFDQRDILAVSLNKGAVSIVNHGANPATLGAGLGQAGHARVGQLPQGPHRGVVGGRWSVPVCGGAGSEDRDSELLGDRGQPRGLCRGVVVKIWFWGLCGCDCGDPLLVRSKRFLQYFRLDDGVGALRGCSCLFDPAACAVRDLLVQEWPKSQPGVEYLDDAAVDGQAGVAHGNAPAEP